jgi:hypothetical protein
MRANQRAYGPVQRVGNGGAAGAARTAINKPTDAALVGWVIHPPYGTSPLGIRKWPVAWAKRRARLSCQASTWTEA